MGFKRETTMRKLILTSTVLLCSLAPGFGCYDYAVTAVPMSIRPVLVAPEAGRPSISPRSYKFRTAVLDFIDQTNSAGDLVRTIPDVLTTTLFDTQRFDIYDRGQLRDKTPSQVEGIINCLAKKMGCTDSRDEGYQIDGMIIGSITRFSPQEHQMTVDIRLINAQSDAVMFAVQQTLQYQGVLDVKVDRADIDRLSKQIAIAIPKVDDAHIVAKNGDEVTINIGEETAGLCKAMVDDAPVSEPKPRKRCPPKKGMAAFVIATGDSLADPGTGDVLASNYIIAEVYITAVEGRITRGHVYHKQKTAWVQPGDLVHFK